MGGIGSWWHAFRRTDRFALIAPCGGMWRVPYGAKLRGTLLYVMNGTFDHHTHVDFARHAHAQMKAMGVPHMDAEDLGGHGRGLAEEQKEALA